MAKGRATRGGLKAYLRESRSGFEQLKAEVEKGLESPPKSPQDERVEEIGKSLLNEDIVKRNLTLYDGLYKPYRYPGVWEMKEAVNNAENRLRAEELEVFAVRPNSIGAKESACRLYALLIFRRERDL